MSDSVRPHPWDSPGKSTGVGCHFLLQCIKVKSESEVTQSCLTLRDPMDCSPPGSSVHGIFQARVKKEFIGPGLHLRPVCADRAWLPLQWTPNSVLSACGNDKGRIRPPLGRGTLKKRKQTLITPASRQCLSKCNHRLIGY